MWRACQAATAVVPGDLRDNGPEVLAYSDSGPDVLACSDGGDLGPPLQPVPEDDLHDRDLASSAEIWRACQARQGASSNPNLTRSRTLTLI